MDIKNTIQSRRSVRTYKKEKLADDLQEKISTILTDIGRGPLKTNARFICIAAKDDQASELKGLGTYGFIKNPPAFIVGAAESTKESLMDYGYMMEKIILHATDMNLGTCWLGGSFSKSSFAKQIQPQGNEIIPAVSSLGYKEENMSRREKFLRKGAKAHTRKPWGQLFFLNTFESPLSEDEAGDYKDILEMLRIGPSASNQQPWRVVKDGNKFHFYCQRSKGYYNSGVKFFGMHDLQIVDIGIAMCHFELSAHDAGLKGSWEDCDPAIKRLPERTEYCITWAAEV